MQQTENYDLNLMDLSDPLRMESREGLNENFTIIDGALKEASENGGVAVQDTQPTTGVLAWIDSDAQGADFCFVGDTAPATDGTVALWVDTSEDEQPIDLVDYIIEQGTSGIWTYRKWKSGIAECWGMYIKNITGINQSVIGMGGMNYNFGVIYFPTGLFIAEPVASVDVMVGTAYATVTYADVTNTRIQLYAQAQTSGEMACKAGIRAIGTWK